MLVFKNKNCKRNRIRYSEKNTAYEKSFLFKINVFLPKWHSINNQQGIKLVHFLILQKGRFNQEGNWQSDKDEFSKNIYL